MKEKIKKIEVRSEKSEVHGQPQYQYAGFSKQMISCFNNSESEKAESAKLKCARFLTLLEMTIKRTINKILEASSLKLAASQNITICQFNTLACSDSFSSLSPFGGNVRRTKGFLTRGTGNLGFAGTSS